MTRSASVAPGATIDLIVSADTAIPGIGTAVIYAIDANPPPAKILSISFGICEGNAMRRRLKATTLYFNKLRPREFRSACLVGRCGRSGVQPIAQDSTICSEPEYQRGLRLRICDVCRRHRVCGSSEPFSLPVIIKWHRI